MLCLSGLECEMIPQIQTDDRGHVVVVQSVVIFGFPSRSRNMHRVSLCDAVLPMSALKDEGGTELLPFGVDVENMSPVELGMEGFTIVYDSETISGGFERVYATLA